MTRFAALQQNRTLVHPQLPQDDPPLAAHNSNNSAKDKKSSDTNAEDASSFTFVVAADPQFGMMQNNANWDAEMQSSRAAVQQINALKPLFCCMCGDLVHMTAEIAHGNEGRSREVCDAIQDEQNKDFQTIWSGIDKDIPLVCLCGNHDM